MSTVAKIDKTGLRFYDQAQTALAMCVRVDEVKDIKKRADAMKAYAKQARNLDLERQAARIRIEAMTKGGELARAELAEKGPSVPPGSKRASKGGKVTASSRVEAVSTLTKDESSEWQQLAQAPEKVTQYLDKMDKEDGVASVAGALAAVNPTKKRTVSINKPYVPDFSELALKVNGHLRDLADIKSFPGKKEFGSLGARTANYLDELIPRLNKLRGNL